MARRRDINQYEQPCALCDALLAAGDGRLTPGTRREVACLDAVGCLARQMGESRQWAEAYLQALGGLSEGDALPRSAAGSPSGPYGMSLR